MLQEEELQQILFAASRQLRLLNLWGNPRKTEEAIELAYDESDSPPAIAHYTGTTVCISKQYVANSVTRFEGFKKMMPLVLHEMLHFFKGTVEDMHEGYLSRLQGAKILPYTCRIMPDAYFRLANAAEDYLIETEFNEKYPLLNAMQILLKTLRAKDYAAGYKRFPIESLSSCKSRQELIAALSFNLVHGKLGFLQAAGILKKSDLPDFGEPGGEPGGETSGEPSGEPGGEQCDETSGEQCDEVDEAMLDSAVKAMLEGYVPDEYTSDKELNIRIIDGTKNHRIPPQLSRRTRVCRGSSTVDTRYTRSLDGTILHITPTGPVMLRRTESKTGAPLSVVVRVDFSGSWRAFLTTDNFLKHILERFTHFCDRTGVACMVYLDTAYESGAFIPGTEALVYILKTFTSSLEDYNCALDTPLLQKWVGNYDNTVCLWGAKQLALRKGKKLLLSVGDGRCCDSSRKDLIRQLDSVVAKHNIEVASIHYGSGTIHALPGHPKTLVSTEQETVSSMEEYTRRLLMH